MNIFQVYFESHNHCGGSHESVTQISNRWEHNTVKARLAAALWNPSLCSCRGSASHAAFSQGLILRGILWLLDFVLRTLEVLLDSRTITLFSKLLPSNLPLSLFFLTSVASIKSITQLIPSWSWYLLLRLASASWRTQTNKSRPGVRCEQTG